MKKPRWTFLAITLVVAFAPIATMAALAAFAEPDYGQDCADRRVVAYGWTNPVQARAEIGAILRWQYAATTRDKIATQWHQARNPYLSCRRIGGDKGQFQCKAAAQPCRFTGGKDHVAAVPP